MVYGKNKASKDSGSGKKQKTISIETKVAVIMKLNSAGKMVNQAYNTNCSTIAIIYKNKEQIMKHVKSVVSMQSTNISKKRGKLIEDIERLGIWLEHKRQRWAPLNLLLIHEKAKSLFEHLRV